MSREAALPATPVAPALAEAAGGRVAGVAVRHTRTAIDAAMAVLLLLQMGRQLMPSAVHEACGIALGALAGGRDGRARC
jgi:hypothetical protein